ncbi:MAG: hypothetical protein DRG09_03580 [Epsilonproteobacteria bacterium]|nr:MAG: hypothetical protein DRG09_03580 [Campylobacterota bacterium]
MAACGYVPEDVLIKQEIIELTTRLEEMGLEKEFCKLIFEKDILHFFNEDAKTNTLLQKRINIHHEK